MASVSPARKAAFGILLDVEDGRSHSDDLLRGKRVERLEVADRNLTTALVLGVLRWQIRLDRQIREHLDRPKARLDREVQIALRLGAFQLRHMDRVPAHAAIGESVELTKQAGHNFAARMVNAVLRKMSALPRSLAADDTEAAIQAHPAWMVERWQRVYGQDAAHTICLHGQEPPATTIRLVGAGTEGELAHAGIEFEPGAMLAAARRVKAGDATETAVFREGRVRLQDEGSQLVAEIASSGSGVAVHDILDLCAAPGGKTLILAERNPRARIVACEASPHRFAELQKRMEPAGGRVACRLTDATVLAEETAFELVLADVPCSGTGTLGRNPEIRHRLNEGDLAPQAERQRAILRAALRAVRSGERVVYSTCSLEPEENEEVVATVIAEMRGTRIVSAQDRLAELRAQGILTVPGAARLQSCVTQEGFLRLLPGAHETDGFFIAMIEKKA